MATVLASTYESLTNVGELVAQKVSELVVECEDLDQQAQNLLHLFQESVLDAAAASEAGDDEERMLHESHSITYGLACIGLLGIFETLRDPSERMF